MSYYSDINRLRKAGYEVVELTEWHYQVTHNGVTCNIWPSRQKYMQEYGSGASYYDDVVEAVQSIVGPPGRKETYAEKLARIKAYLNELYPIPIETPAIKAWRYELNIITNWVHRKTAKARQRREDMDF